VRRCRQRKSIVVCTAAAVLMLLTARVALAQEPAFKACMIDEEPWGNAAEPAKSIYAETFQQMGLLLD